MQWYFEWYILFSNTTHSCRKSVIQLISSVQQLKSRKQLLHQYNMLKKTTFFNNSINIRKYFEAFVFLHFFQNTLQFETAMIILFNRKFVLLFYIDVANFSTLWLYIFLFFIITHNQRCLIDSVRYIGIFTTKHTNEFFFDNSQSYLPLRE